MRRSFDHAPFDGRVAIGEGERDDAPMLYIGEPIGAEVGREGALQLDIAVDPLECTNNCADNLPNSIAVLAAAPRGALLHAPDCYMDKIAAGPALAGHVDLDGEVAWNLEQAAHALDREVSDVRVVALDRDRHAALIREVKDAGAQLELMSDGDVSAAIWAARDDGPFDLLLGIGAAPEGVITAAAIRGLGGVFQGRLVSATTRKPPVQPRWWAMTSTVDGKQRTCVRPKMRCSSLLACATVTSGVVMDDHRTVTTSEIIDVASGTRRTMVTERRR